MACVARVAAVSADADDERIALAAGGSSDGAASARVATVTDEPGSPATLRHDELLFVLIDAMWSALVRDRHCDASPRGDEAAAFDAQPLDVLPAISALRAEQQRRRAAGDGSGALDVAERRLAAVALAARSPSHAPAHWRALLSFAFNIMAKQGARAAEEGESFAAEMITALWRLVQTQRDARVALASGAEARALLSLVRAERLSSSSAWVVCLCSARELVEVTALVLPLRLAERGMRDPIAAKGLAAAVATSVPDLMLALRETTEKRALRVLVDATAHVLRSAWLASADALQGACGESAHLLAELEGA